jgi:hypothetical protein
MDGKYSEMALRVENEKWEKVVASGSIGAAFEGLVTLLEGPGAMLH